MKSKVILVNQFSGYLMVDIVNAYCKVYDEVVLLAGKVMEYERPLSTKVEVHSIMAYSKKNILHRIATWLIGFLQSFFYILFKGKDATVIYVTNPPLSYFSALLLKNRFSIIEYDIYPNALKNIGIKEDNFIYKIWKKINCKVFCKAECIYTLSDGMADLLSEYVERNKMKVISNWGSVAMAAVPKDINPFVKRYHLERKFVVMYSGNIGYTHNVETILDLAVRLRNDTDVHFMIIGDGGKKADLVKKAELEDLSNCTFLDWQPADSIVYSLSAADLSIVTLTDDTAFVSVPSKTYNILSVGSPLLCIAPKQSEISVLVKREECGKCFDKEEVRGMLDYIKRLKEDINYKSELSVNALKASAHYTHENANQYVVI